MTTFVLLHGGGHRGWHWNRLAPELARLGHDMIAPDMPMDNQACGAADWADVVLDAVGDPPAEDLVVVGHSLAGLTLPIVAARLRPRRMVFLCANVPTPGVVFEAYVAAHPDAIIVPWERIEEDEAGRIVVPWELAREMYYADCDEALAREAYEHVVPTATTGFKERCPLDAWPDVPATYILCTEDRVLGPSWAREISRERFGQPAIELPGSHSPFLSRPAPLAGVLDELARA